MFGPVYSLYVTGFTFAWDRFYRDNGGPPPSPKRKEYSYWAKNELADKLEDYILSKDIAFDVDARNGRIKTAGEHSLTISDHLDDIGMRHYHIFSGTKGYHTVIENGQDLFKEPASSPDDLFRAAVKIARDLLDDIFDDPYLDRGNSGRSYDDVEIDFSPMFPQGVRKAAYSLTDNGTVALPVNDSDLAGVDNTDHYRPENIMKKYRIKGRGWYV
jgi:DNA primase